MKSPERIQSGRELNREEELVLIERAKGGDDEAWSELYVCFWKRLRGFIAPRIGGKFEEAEDLAQNVFIEVHRNLRKYDPNYRFFTLLSGTAKFRIKDYWRGRYLRMNVPGSQQTTELNGKGKPGKHSSKRAKARTNITDQNSSENSPQYKPKETLFTDFVAPTANESDREIADYLSPPEAAKQIGNVEFLELFKLFIICEAMPHQKLVFGFVRLIEWTPAEFVKELSPWLLRPLSEKLCKDYHACIADFLSMMDFSDLYCSHLHDEMDKKVGAVYDLAQYCQLSADEDRKVGELAFKVFFPEPTENRGPSHAIWEWCREVKRKIRSFYQEP